MSNSEDSLDFNSTKLKLNYYNLTTSLISTCLGLSLHLFPFKLLAFLYLTKTIRAGLRGELSGIFKLKLFIEKREASLGKRMYQIDAASL